VTNSKCLFLAEDIFCTNYRGGEGRNALSWANREDFARAPLATMKNHNASIICVPVPVGAISLPDHKLQMDNPISLTGRLPTGLRELVPSGENAGNIGDYLDTGRTEAISLELAEMWQKKYDAMPQLDRQKFTDRNPCPLIARHLSMNGQEWSSQLSQMWKFGEMNHEADYGSKQTFETSSTLINTMCFHT
jgi:hypothetical protein